jgi:hypothetical protein
MNPLALVQTVKSDDLERLRDGLAAANARLRSGQAADELDDLLRGLRTLRWRLR